MPKIILFLVLFYAEQAICDSSVLKVGIGPDYLPWEGIDNGKAAGINIKIIENMAQSINLDISFEAYPFKRVLQLLAAGKVDLACSLDYDDTRAQYVEYLQPAYSPSVSIFLVKKNSDTVIHQYEDLYHYTIGLRLDHKHFPRFDTDGRLRKLEVQNNEQLFRILMAGRVDTIVGTHSQLLYQAKLLGYGKYLETAGFKVHKGRSGYCGLSKKSSFLHRKQEFESVLKNMLDTGEIDNIINVELQL